MPASQLDREEYIEQAYFFRVYRERLADGVPSQLILDSIHEEILATTKLPFAISFLTGEMVHTGKMGAGMARLSHYFTPFQAFVIDRAEDEVSRFEQLTALLILEREAEYRSQSPTPAGLFIYQFECISRNRLGYDRGLSAIAADPFYDEDWRDWILKTKRQLGDVEFADLIYWRSEFWLQERQRKIRQEEYQPPYPILFGVQEGRIAKANRGKEPLHMFSALQRQLNYPAVPKPAPSASGPIIHPALEARLQKIEKHLHLLDGEAKGGIDLSEFIVKPPHFGDEPAPPPD
ncbi:MAG: hypothetical protein WEB58_04995 [Planctomycetaceae bacterium]